MAIYRPSPNPKPIRIDRWLGINEAYGETGLRLGEALRQVNYRITKDYKPEKRKGHKTWIDFENAKAVQGIWEGVLGGTDVFIACNNGKVYKRNMSISSTKTKISELIADGVASEVGTITDAKTTIFYFNSKLYFLNGTDYKEYDGTTYQDVVPYIPTVLYGAAPTGAGTEGESINLLTGTKKAAYVGNGSATAYTLPETNIDAAAITATVAGVAKVETTDFTVNRSTGIVTFLVAPVNLADVVIQWTKVTAGNADLVKKNRFAMAFGPGNDTSIFMWGNTSQKNARIWSGALNAGYFPVINQTLIGSNQFAITDIKPVYDRQIIFKEDRTHYSYAEYQTTTGTYDYPVYDLNEKVGNVAFGQVQIVENSPISIKGQSWWKWTSTSVEDERNAQVISEKLRQSLSDIDLKTSVTFDHQSEKEYWCNVGSIVYIWNYGNDTMYKFDNVTATCFIDVNNTVYYGTTGKVERFEGLNDNGVKITAQLDTGFMDFGLPHMIKNTDTVFVGLKPDSLTSINIFFKTNRQNDWKAINKKVEYRLLDFNYIDFNNLSFKTNQNPQTFNRRLRAKNYTSIQFRFENAELEETCVFLDFLVECESQGEVR